MELWAGVMELTRAAGVMELWAVAISTCRLKPLPWSRQRHAVRARATGAAAACEQSVGQWLKSWRTPKKSSVGPFGYACAPLYASEHVKQRTQGTEPTGR
jgi:hypothetical protein